MLLLALTAVAAPAAPQELPRPLFSIRSAGSSAILRHPKDAGLLRAWRLLPERFADLSAELGQAAPPPGLVELALELLGEELSLDVAFGSATVDGMPFSPFAELVASRADEGAALELAAGVYRVCADLGLDLGEPTVGALAPLSVPMPVPLEAGVLGRGFCLRVGGPPRPEPQSGLATDAALLPADVRTLVSGSLDLGGLLALFDQGASAGAPLPPELQSVRDLLAGLELGASRVEFALGAEPERQRWAFRLTNCAGLLGALGLADPAPLGADFLRVIPADALWATASVIDASEWLRSLQRLIEGAQPVDVAQELSDLIGFDVQQELLEPLGRRMALYASDTTGGGGLASWVAVVELKDSARFRPALERMIERANFGLLEGTGAAMWIAPRELDGRTLYSLVGLGVPIPAEPSFAVADGHLVLGATPGAVLAALGHLAGGGVALPDHPGFRAQAPPGLDRCHDLTWVDTPRLAREGYGTLAFATSSLTNVLRSKSNPARDAGVLLPPFRELVHGARGVVALSTRSADEWRTTVHADASFGANAAGLVGQFLAGPYPLIVTLGLAGSIAVPQVLQATESARESKARADLFQLEQALMVYALNNAGRYPESLEALVVRDANGVSYLNRTTLPRDPWGELYEYELRSGGREFVLRCRTLDGR